MVLFTVKEVLQVFSYIKRGEQIMKKVCSILLALMICCSVSIPALADDGDKVAELILTAKETFSISDDDFVFEDYSKSEQDGQQAVYHLWWTSRNDDPYIVSDDRISVSIREDGAIESYDLNVYSNEEQGLPKYSKDDARAAADAFSATVNSSRAAQVQFTSVDDANRYSNTYTVHYTRYANGIPVPQNQISISIDAQALTPVSYHASWSDVDFANPDSAIDASTANAAYQEKLGYELAYEFVYRDDKQVPMLVYREKYSDNAYIDAFTGELYQPSEQYRVFDAAASSGGGNSMKEESAQLSPEEQAFIAEVEQMITREEAESIARAVPEFEITDEFVCDNYSVYKGYDEQYTVSLHFSATDEDGKTTASKSVGIDAKTKQVLSYSGYDYADLVKSISQPEISREDGQKTAEAFLNAHYADQFAQTRPENTLRSEGTSYSYDRLVNGVPVLGNGFSVSINNETGKLSSFNLRWSSQEFPSASNVRPLEELYAIVLDGYAPAYIIETVPSSDGNSTKQQSHLVYQLKEENRYDAGTLEAIDYNGYPLDTQTPAYDDISGHWCEEAANKLLEIGVYFAGGQLKPDATVTQSEYLNLIAQVVSGRTFSDETELLKYCISAGILDREDIHPGQEITRIEAVTCLLNAMGFQKAANIPGIYNCPFTDVTNTPDTGYAAIAGGLGLVSTQADTFNPANTLTRAEAITMLYNYLNS